MAANLLLCLESEFISRLTSRECSKVGITVQVAQDSKSCFEAVWRIRPALLILDGDSPQVDAYGTLEMIRSTPDFEDLTVALLLDEVSDSASANAYRRGADLCLAKPLDMGLIFKVAQFLTH